MRIRFYTLLESIYAEYVSLDRTCIRETCVQNNSIHRDKPSCIISSET